MKKEKLFLCAKCEVGAVRILAKPGRTMRYKNFPALEVPARLEIPTCDNCGEMWFDSKTSRTVSREMEKVFRGELRRRVAHIIDLLSKVITQGQLEMLLGQSQGYLSKLKSGERTPSPELMIELALIARDPKKRIREIQEILAS